MRNWRMLPALVSVAVLPALLIAAAPAQAVSVSVRWNRQTDDPQTGAQMNMPMDGSTGYSGWPRHSSPALGDLDGRPGAETAIGTLDGKLYVFRADGSRLPGFPKRLDSYSTPVGPISGGPAIGDIDGDGRNDVVVGDDNGWVFAFDGNGNIKPGWPQFTGYNGDYPQNCALAACTGVIAAPTLADLNGDGTLEVIAGSHSHLVYVWDGHGRVMPGWPRDVWDGVADSAAVGDLDGDGSPDIVIGSDVANDCPGCSPPQARGGRLHAFRVDGTELPGWPVPTDSFMSSSPALADLDGDGRMEAIVGGGYFLADPLTRGHAVRAYDSLGRVKWTFPTHGVMVGAIAVGDVNGDGRPEVAFGDTGCSGAYCAGGYTYLLAGDGREIWERNPTTKNEPAGAGAIFGSAVLGDVTGDGLADVVVSDANWNVHAYSADGTLVLEQGTMFSMWNAPAVGDLDGNGTNEIVLGSAAQDGTPNRTLPELAGHGVIWALNTPGHGGLAWPQDGARVAQRPPAMSINERYDATGGLGGWLGAPTSAEQQIPQGAVRHYTGGDIYWSPNIGAFTVGGAILAKYRGMGGPNSFLGMPTSGESAVPGGRVNNFAGGRLYWSSGAGAFEVHGAILSDYLLVGGPGVVGLPIGDETATASGRASAFTNGTVYWTPDIGAHAVYGSINASYQGLDGPGGTLGPPVSDEGAAGPGRVSVFARGRIYWTPNVGTGAVYGAILNRYLEVGGPDSYLGMPVTDEFGVPGGRQNNFQHGLIRYDIATGRIDLG